MRDIRGQLALILIVGCTPRGSSVGIGRVVVDTLPGGVLRTVTEAPIGWTDSGAWTLVEVTRIGGGAGGPGELQLPNDATVDGLGRVYVAERIRPVIKVYAPNGTFLHTIGREGEGPGEFERAFVAISEPRLFVHDPRSSRTSLFDTSGAYLRSWPSVCCVSDPIQVDDSGAVAVPAAPPAVGVRNGRNRWQRTVRWYRADSTVADSALVPAGPEERHWTVAAGGGKVLSTPIPYEPRMLFAFLPDHRMITGVGDRYVLAITRRDGTDTTALFSRAWAGTSIPRREREAAVGRLVDQNAPYADVTMLRNTFDVDDVPATAPAFDWTGVDGAGDIWVRTPAGGGDTTVTFDVFDPGLRWLGQVRGPAELTRGEIKLVGNTFVVMGEDDQGGPRVTIYEIRGSGSTVRRVGG